MKREMYKKDRQMSAESVEKAFSAGNHGTLAVNGDDGYPYAVPVNYVYDNGKIYIHSAKYGYKIEALKNSDRVCFSAILNSRVQQDMFTAAYQSVVAFGRASFVEMCIRDRCSMTGRTGPGNSCSVFRMATRWKAYS